MDAKVLLTLFLNFVRSDGPDTPSVCARGGGAKDTGETCECGESSMSMSCSSKDGPSLVLDESAKDIMDTVPFE